MAPVSRVHKDGLGGIREDRGTAGTAVEQLASLHDRWCALLRQHTDQTCLQVLMGKPEQCVCLLEPQLLFHRGFVFQSYILYILFRCLLTTQTLF